MLCIAMCINWVISTVYGSHPHLSHTFLRDISCDLLRHLQPLRTHIPQSYTVQGQQPSQRVHRPTVLQITNQSYLGVWSVTMATSKWYGGCCGHTNGESVDGADLLSDGEDVKQSLCRMFSNSVSGIDDGAVGHSAGPLGVQ